jgi:UDP-glucose 4,6-dehydratase
MPAQAVLITGAAGFIGAHYANHLFDTTEARLVLVDALYYSADLARLREDVRASPRVVFVQLNLRSAWGQLQQLLRDHAVSTVVHFAAQSHVGRCFAQPLEFTEDNVLGTHTLLECARLHGAVRFLHISTDEVYGSSSMAPDAVASTEAAALCPTNPYAASKAAAEHLVQAYHRSFGMHTLVTRGNNVYGRGQHPEKLIPGAIARLARGEPLPLEGDGQQLRAFVHVGDVCRALDLLLERGLPGHAYNLGATEERSVEAVLRLLAHKMGKTPSFSVAQDRPFNDRRYFVDSSKLRALGWAEQWTFDRGLEDLLSIPYT